jgi:CheY-like chemotaxis protein
LAEEQIVSRRTVLCALDNRDLARIFEKALDGAGYEVLTVHDGVRALAAWREGQPDLMISDVSLSKRDGFDVVETISRDGVNEQVSSPIILLSDSRISPHYQQRADALGVELLLAKPVPLDTLLEHVNDLIKPPPHAKHLISAQSKRSDRSDSKPSTKPMSGTFIELPFPRLLHQLHGLRATGILMLASGRKRKAIELREGVPIAIKSNLVHECLGNVLVRRGILTQAQQQESLKRMERGEGLQGEILIAMEFVDEQTLANALCEQARGKLFEIFEWEKGRFELEVRSQIRRANALALNSSTANVILEGVRHHYPIAAVDKFLSTHGKRYPVPAGSPFYRFQEIDLEADEAELVSRLDGLSSLETYAGADERMRRALFGLLVTGMFELRQQESSGAGNDETKRVSNPGPKQRVQDETAIRAELAELAKHLRDKNYFEILGVAQSCTDLVLEQAYSDLARRAHPDRFQTKSLAIRELASEVYERVNQAYESLRDRARRQQYILELQIGDGRGTAGESDQRAITAETAFQKGLGLIQRRAYEEALAHFGKSLEQNPEDGEYHAYYGWCLYLCNPTASTIIGEAIEHVKRGARLAGDREKPFLFLGRLYKVIGKVAPAERMFTRAVQIQPECVEALRELRLINLRREKRKGLIQRILRR